MNKHFFLFICSFFFALGHNFLNFSLIYRLTDVFSFNPGQVGAFIATGHLFYFFGCVLYHRFGSTANPTRIIPVASVVVFLVSIPLGFVRILGTAYVSYWLLQITSSMFWPPIMAWLTEGLSGSELSRRISHFNRSWMSALIIAPPLAGFLYRWNSDINFFIICLSFLTNIILIFLVIRASKVCDTGKERVIQTAEISETEKHGPSALQQSKKLHIFRHISWICFFCSVIFAGVFVNIVPIHIRDTLGYTESTAGWVLFFRCVAGFIAFVLLAKFAAWHFSFRWVVILQAGLALCAFIFLLAGGNLPFYFGIGVLYGLINAASNTNSVFYSRTTGKNPKKNLAIHEMLMCSGSAIGTAGGGLIYQRFGFAGTWFAILLALSVCLGFITVLIKRSIDKS